MSNPEKPLAARIRWIMENRGVSQSELGRVADVKRQTVGHWVKDSKKSTKALSGPVAARLCQAYGLRMEWLMHGEGDPEVEHVPLMDLAYLEKVIVMICEALNNAGKRINPETLAQATSMVYRATEGDRDGLRAMVKSVLRLIA